MWLGKDKYAPIIDALKVAITNKIIFMGHYNKTTDSDTFSVANSAMCVPIHNKFVTDAAFWYSIRIKRCVISKILVQGSVT